jgi:hypothetical protein
MTEAAAAAAAAEGERESSVDRHARSSSAAGFPSFVFEFVTAYKYPPATSCHAPLTVYCRRICLTAKAGVKIPPLPFPLTAFVIQLR